MFNAAFSLGLGSCWVHRERQMFESDEGKAPAQDVGPRRRVRRCWLVLLGYPDGDWPEAAPRKDGYVVTIGRARRPGGARPAARRRPRCRAASGLTPAPAVVALRRAAGRLGSHTPRRARARARRATRMVNSKRPSAVGPTNPRLMSWPTTMWANCAPTAISTPASSQMGALKTPSVAISRMGVELAHDTLSPAGATAGCSAPATPPGRTGRENRSRRAWWRPRSPCRRRCPAFPKQATAPMRRPQWWSGPAPAWCRRRRPRLRGAPPRSRLRPAAPGRARSTRARRPPGRAPTG